MTTKLKSIIISEIILLFCFFIGIKFYISIVVKSIEKIPSSSVSIVSTNLWNEADLINGSYPNPDTGKIVNNEKMIRTGYINVNPAENYCVSNSYSNIAFYNKKRTL